MKKFYTLALTAVVATSATATENFTASPAAENAHMKVCTAVTLPAAKPTIKPMSTEYDNYTWNYIGDGKYKASVMAGIYDVTDELVDVKIYEAENHSGVYKAVGVWPDMLDNGALIVDASDPDFIVVPKQDTGYKDAVDKDTYIASRNWVMVNERGYTAEQLKAEDPNAVPSLIDGCIYFKPVGLLVQWPNAPLNSQYNTVRTQWYADQLESGCLVLPGGKYVSPWKRLGTGKVTGDMYFSAFGKTSADYEVDVYKSTDLENTYRIVDPLAGLYKALDIDEISPSWTIDTSVEDNISINTASSGILDDSEKTSYIVGTMNQYYGLEDCPKDNRASVSYDDKKTTFSFPATSLLIFDSSAGKVYYGNRYDAQIVVSHETEGVNDLIQDTDTNAPVEFFNLQGQRIDTPATGQLVIKRQGSKVTKLIVK